MHMYLDGTEAALQDRARKAQQTMTTAATKSTAAEVRALSISLADVSSTSFQIQQHRHSHPRVEMRSAKKGCPCLLGSILSMTGVGVH